MPLLIFPTGSNPKFTRCLIAPCLNYKMMTPSLRNTYATTNNLHHDKLFMFSKVIFFNQAKFLIRLAISRTKNFKNFSRFNYPEMIKNDLDKTMA